MYYCNFCGLERADWAAQCFACEHWDTIVYRIPAPVASAPPSVTRFLSGLDALNEVSGGGFVKGAFYLLGGDPGAGKSTLILQVAARFAEDRRVMYATSEETARMIEDRLLRLGSSAPLRILASDDLDDVLEQAPGYSLFVDSLTMMRTKAIAAGAGSPSQLKACAHALMTFAREHGRAVIAIGQVTKEGSFAGPNTVAHLADCLLYLEQIGTDERRRLTCRMKNRYGPSNVARLLQMDAAGLHDIEDSPLPIVKTDSHDAGNENVDAGAVKE